MSKRWISMSKKKHRQEGSSLKKLAAGSLTFVKAYSSGEANTAIDNLEDELEAELERERQSQHTSGFARLRHRGGKILRSKHVLLCIVLLNMVDCALVLGKLVLDLHHVKEIMMTQEEMSLLFQTKLQQIYPEQFTVLGADKIQHTYDTVLNSKLIFKENSTSDSGVNTTTDYKDVEVSLKRSVRDSTENLNPRTRRHFHRRVKRGTGNTNPAATTTEAPTTEEILAIACHKLSIIIVCTLLTETIMKVVCFGRRFWDNKLEVFDALIVVASFVVDFVFLNMPVDSIQQFILILAFMLPWGVTRVVNSLVVAVRDHEHFRLKLLYTQKKKTDSENKQLKQDREKLNEQLDALRRLCLAEVVEEWKVSQSLARQMMRPGKGIMGSFASLALGAIGGGRSNGASIWNLLGTPKLRRGKSEEWEGKLGVNRDKDETKSLRSTNDARTWTIVGTPDIKKHRHSKSLPHQNTVESDPGSPTVIKGKIRALKRFLRRQDPVDSGSFSSIETAEKDSKCSLDKMTASDASSPPHSFDYESLDDTDNHVTPPVCEIINECSPEASIMGDESTGTITQGNEVNVKCKDNSKEFNQVSEGDGDITETDDEEAKLLQPIRDIDTNHSTVLTFVESSEQDSNVTEVTIHHDNSCEVEIDSVSLTKKTFPGEYILQEVITSQSAAKDTNKLPESPQRKFSACSHTDDMDDIDKQATNQTVATIAAKCDSKSPSEMCSDPPSVKSRSLSLQLPHINHLTYFVNNNPGKGGLRIKSHSKTTDDIYLYKDSEHLMDSGSIFLQTNPHNTSP